MAGQSQHVSRISIRAFTGPFTTPSTDPMTKSKLPLGPYCSKDKNGRYMYFYDRKRIKQKEFFAITWEQAKIAQAEAEAADKLDQLLAEIKALQMPKVTPLEARLLALSCYEETGFFAGYAEALSLCNQNPMSANALIGSMARKGLIMYESKQDAQQRVGGLLSSQFVQDARCIYPTDIGSEIGRKQLQEDLAFA